MKTTPDAEMISRIIGLMQKKNMTARALTRELGISQTSVTEWKKGKTTPSVDHVRRIAQFFDVSTDYIINGSEFQKVVVTDEDIDALDTEMYDVFCTLCSEHKAVIRDFIKLCLLSPGEKKKKTASCKTEKTSELLDADETTDDAAADFDKRMAAGEFGEFNPDDY